jgi:hypothetical protein
MVMSGNIAAAMSDYDEESNATLLSNSPVVDDGLHPSTMRRYEVLVGPADILAGFQAVFGAVAADVGVDPSRMDFSIETDSVNERGTLRLVVKDESGTPIVAVREWFRFQDGVIRDQAMVLQDLRI